MIYINVAKYFSNEKDREVAKLIRAYQKRGCTDHKICASIIESVIPVIHGFVSAYLVNYGRIQDEDLFDELQIRCLIDFEKTIYKINPDLKIFTWINKISLNTCRSWCKRIHGKHARDRSHELHENIITKEFNHDAIERVKKIVEHDTEIYRLIDKWAIEGEFDHNRWLKWVARQNIEIGAVGRLKLYIRTHWDEIFD